MSASDLLRSGPKVINIGLPNFAADLERNRVEVLHLAWQPPATTDARVLSVLEALTEPSVRARIDAANETVLQKMTGAQPRLIGVALAGDVVDGLGDKTILHAGPPIAWERMCGPMRGAIAGAIVYESWADNLVEAEKLAASGAIHFAPNHHFGLVGPMTGLTTRGMPVMIVENVAASNRAYCTINEGLGKVMRFGGNDESVINRLRWIAGELAPLMARALEEAGGIDLKTIIARGLGMGD